MSDLPYISQVTDLSIELMERDPESYWELLCYFSGPYSHIPSNVLKQWLNEKPDTSWNSNHAFCVSLLVGKMNSEALESFGESSDSYYGGRLTQGIDEDFGIKLLDKIIECGGDITAKNYYDDNIVEQIDGSNRFKRTGNEKFKEHLKEVYAKAREID